MHRSQLSDDVATYLREQILAGGFVPGQAVRTEAVGRDLDVSATPVREALQALRVEGFLDLVPRKGFTVAPLTGEDIRDIFEAYALIAGELTARAAARVDPAQLQELRAVHEQLLESAKNGENERLEQLNHDFHRQVYLIAGSKRLRWALSSFAKYVPSTFYSQIDGWPEATAADHGEIFAALENHDADKARELMAQHVRDAGEKLSEYFAKRQRSTK
ncbi:GntR family transcriptional regulator [Flexivirga caeni]|uniref:GntR family transcriptional regulator n=1 Tax=Flexivirga caeni TaxID=2294115 RepID=A0A3M9MJ53_9MICO|nr:GntR family transcriptional regulator [Flexivirga caeni]RNI24698.1 GntR family transcriptional regulator [Flexivirga caeni]